METDDVVSEKDSSDNLSIKTDIKGNRIVVKTNDLSNNQNKLISIKKPIIKRTTTKTTTVTVLRNNNDDQQGQVALKLLGEFIKKPQNDNNKDRSILNRLKF